MVGLIKPAAGRDQWLYALHDLPNYYISPSRLAGFDATRMLFKCPSTVSLLRPRRGADEASVITALSLARSLERHSG